MSNPTIGQRKADHIALCATGDVGFRRVTTLFEDVRFVHDALPDLALDDIDLSVTVLGKRLRAPLLIAAMTGGTDDAARINRELATIAEKRGYAFGLGSQRAMWKRAEASDSYRVRGQAPTTLVLGNLGLIQARDMKSAEVQALADAVGADAMCIHLNPAMELVQPGGDRDFRGGQETLARLVRELTVPVVAKETGCGISRGVGERLRSVGVRHLDVSGAGGTSWVGVETERARSGRHAEAVALGEAFWDWGIPTAASVASASPLGFETVFATGGVQSGLDVAKALALGATVGGIARPVLRALLAEGTEGASRFLDQVEFELRAAMLLTGSANVAGLRRAPKRISGELASWVGPHAET